MTRPGVRRAALAVPALVVLTGCGANVEGADDDLRAADAADAVECEVVGDRGNNTDGFDDREAEGSARDALDGYVDDLTDWPRDGYQATLQSEDRVLYTWDTAERTTLAVVVHDGETISGDGWYVEAWARCDWSEFPDEVTDALGVQIWADGEGRRLPTTTIESSRGPEHCDWQTSTILTLGEDTYWRRPVKDLADFFDIPYGEGLALPDNAVDTGYQRGGQRLWLSPDRAVAYVGTPVAVERWPRPRERIACA